MEHQAKLRGDKLLKLALLQIVIAQRELSLLWSVVLIDEFEE